MLITVHLWYRGCQCIQRDWCDLSGYHLAARIGNFDMVLLYLTFGIDVDEPGENGWTALHEAISSRNIDIIRLLLNRGASITKQNIRGETAVEIGLKARFSQEEIEALFDPSVKVTSNRETERMQFIDLVTKQTNGGPTISNLPSTVIQFVRNSTQNQSCGSLLNTSGSSVASSPIPGTTAVSKTKQRRSTVSRLQSFQNKLFMRNSTHGDSIPAVKVENDLSGFTNSGDLDINDVIGGSLQMSSNLRKSRSIPNDLGTILLSDGIGHIKEKEKSKGLFGGRFSSLPRGERSRTRE